ncbi:hypothetical protein [uncultured Psychroserpens sp.]|nr:hypothetical protein [uncultured Psychroserpens sp.]
MEKRDEKGYEGFWKHLGCTLTAIVGIVFIWVIVMLIKMAFFKF